MLTEIFLTALLIGGKGSYFWHKMKDICLV